MIESVFGMNYYWLIDKLPVFVSLLQIINQLILSYPKLSHLRWYNQENFRLLGPSLRTGIPLMKNEIKLLAESASIPLVLTAVASVAADTEYIKKS